MLIFLITSHCKLELLKKSHYLLTDPRIMFLGLEILHAITKSQSYQLQVNLKDWLGNTVYAQYRYKCSTSLLVSN